MVSPRNKAYTVVTVVLLQALDIFSTKLGLLREGVGELNPLAGWFFSRDMWLEFFFLKLGVLFLVFGCGYLIGTTQKTFVQMAWVLNAIMVFVIFNNFYWYFMG
jgi:hypothetical protein